MFFRARWESASRNPLGVWVFARQPANWARIYKAVHSIRAWARKRTGTRGFSSRWLCIRTFRLRPTWFYRRTCAGFQRRRKCGPRPMRSSFRLSWRRFARRSKYGGTRATPEHPKRPHGHVVFAASLDTSYRGEIEGGQRVNVHVLENDKQELLSSFRMSKKKQTHGKNSHFSSRPRILAT